MKSKLAMCLSRFTTASKFVNAYNKANDKYILADKYLAVNNDVSPTITIAKMTFGESVVKIIIEQHLQELAIAFGVRSTRDAISYIADDIIDGYYYLKMSELILALHLIRQGKIREPDDYNADGTNAAKMYGVISTQSICNCLHIFCTTIRARYIEQREQRERELRRIEDDKNAVNGFEFIAARSLDDLTIMDFFKQYLTKQQMKELEYYVQERKVLLLLKERVEQYLDGQCDKDKLAKAIEYINTNFPSNPQQSADKESGNIV